MGDKLEKTTEDLATFRIEPTLNSLLGVAGFTLSRKVPRLFWTRWEALSWDYKYAECEREAVKLSSPTVYLRET